MKLIFLDVDGVLNSKETLMRRGGLYDIDPSLVKKVLRITKETGAQIVLSSSWRHSDWGLDAVRQAGIRFIGITPSLPSGHRGSEIEAWLERNKHRAVIEKFCIIDDDSDMHEYQKHFKTSFEKGLTDEIADDIIKFLNE